MHLALEVVSGHTPNGEYVDDYTDRKKRNNQEILYKIIRKTNLLNDLTFDRFL